MIFRGYGGKSGLVPPITIGKVRRFLVTEAL